MVSGVPSPDGLSADAAIASALEQAVAASVQAVCRNTAMQIARMDRILGGAVIRTAPRSQK